MTGAHVRSLESVRDFRAAWIAVGEDAAKALAAADQEIQRAIDWLENDLAAHWQAQVRRGEDRVVEARLDLERCLITAMSGAAACSDQRIALEKAKRRLEHAREMVDRVRRWTLIVRKEIGEYQAPARQFASLLDANLPAGTAMLDRALASLEAYAGGAPPTLERVEPPSMARPIDAGDHQAEKPAVSADDAASAEDDQRFDPHRAAPTQ